MRIRFLFSMLHVLLSVAILQCEDLTTVGRTTEDGVRVRSAPSLDAPLLLKLEEREVVVVLEATAPVQFEPWFALWYKIRTSEGQSGWAFGHYIASIDSEAKPARMSPTEFLRTEVFPRGIPFDPEQVVERLGKPHSIERESLEKPMWLAGGYITAVETWLYDSFECGLSLFGGKMAPGRIVVSLDLQTIVSVKRGDRYKRVVELFGHEDAYLRWQEIRYYIGGDFFCELVFRFERRKLSELIVYYPWT